MNIKKGSVGIVETEYFTFGYPPDQLILSSGKKLGPVTIAYETYGKLNGKKNNAILLNHAFAGDAHAAGCHTAESNNQGWWDEYVGPGKAFDTEKYYVICSNVLSGCNGSTGPSSIDSATGRRYGLDFPVITISDMVKAQYYLIKYLGIDKLLAVSGGSMGGMQALQWTILYPDMMNSCIAIASSASLSAQGIAFNEVKRQAILNDPLWNNGNYYDGEVPRAGLSLARMIGNITYLSEKHMRENFGRKFQDSGIKVKKLSSQYMVESYLRHQGIQFVERFDANSYLYITRAIDHFDLKENYGGSLTSAFENVKANFLIISFTTDWLYPGSNSREIVRALRVNGKNVNYADIEADNGHDSFLLPNAVLEKNISFFLRNEFSRSAVYSEG